LWSFPHRARPTLGWEELFGTQPFDISCDILKPSDADAREQSSIQVVAPLSTLQHIFELAIHLRYKLEHPKVECVFNYIDLRRS
jgi:hypothetical protein